jgi:ribonuclease HII
VAISYKDETHIDDHNILQSAQEAMCEALCETRRIVQQRADYDANRVEHALVDGNTFRPSTPSPVHHTCVVKGDSEYFAIACAAIVAKVAHDRYIAELCEKHPSLNERYGLLKNMGYGTKKHLDGIKEFGVTSMHRLSFWSGGMAWWSCCWTAVCSSIAVYFVYTCRQQKYL